MKAICQGDNTYDIFDDSLRVFSELPAQSYVVRFSKNRGFFLEKYVELDMEYEKAYGVHESKIEKVLNAFADVDRSLGVILSGDKGIGKSFFVKMLSASAIRSGLPVIVVDSYIPGIASYIESIEQQVVVLFDEFDKTFADIRAEDGKASPQAELLTLFDGLSGGKRLFVITCNDIRKLSEYLVNRPGRFHYHFRFDYPNPEEIRQYLRDKLDPKYYSEIDSVVSFSCKVSLNYDCLRAIAFELNHGLPFSDAIKDLNIINTEDETYALMLKFEDGHTYSRKSINIDMFDSDGTVTSWLDNSGGYTVAYVDFSPSDALFDGTSGMYIIPGEKLRLNNFSDENDEDCGEDVKFVKANKPLYLVVKRKLQKSIHYAI